MLANTLALQVHPSKPNQAQETQPNTQTNQPKETNLGLAPAAGLALHGDGGGTLRKPLANPMATQTRPYMLCYSLQTKIESLTQVKPLTQDPRTRI